MGISLYFAGLAALAGTVLTLPGPAAPNAPNALPLVKSVSSEMIGQLY